MLQDNKSDSSADPTTKAGDIESHQPIGKPYCYFYCKFIGLWTKCVLPLYMAVGQALYPHILGRFTGLSKLQKFNLIP